MKIVIGNDHAGVEFKNKIMQELRSKGHEIINVGTDTLDSVDYPDIAKEVSKKIINKEANFGILICVNGIRAALCHNEYTARLSRLHNDANIIALGARVLGEDLGLACVETFINTEFEGGRHARRVGKIEQ